MIRCQNLSQIEIERIGHQVAEAFRGEKGCFSVLSQNEADKLFRMVIKICYESGHLYTTSEKQEGFCVYWTKKERPGFLVQMKIGIKMIGCLSIRSSIKLMNSQNNWKPTEKRYQKRDDFVEVFLLAVRKEYQGQGYFRTMLKEPFDLAKKRGTICVLDTDSDKKAAKYCHVGMKIVDSKVQKSGVEMFALEL